MKKKKVRVGKGLMLIENFALKEKVPIYKVKMCRSSNFKKNDLVVTKLNISMPSRGDWRCPFIDIYLNKKRYYIVFCDKFEIFIDKSNKKVRWMSQSNNPPNFKPRFNCQGKLIMDEE